MEMLKVLKILTDTPSHFTIMKVNPEITGRKSPNRFVVIVEGKAAVETQDGFVGALCIAAKMVKK